MSVLSAKIFDMLNESLKNKEIENVSFGVNRHRIGAPPQPGERGDLRKVVTIEFTYISKPGGWMRGDKRPCGLCGRDGDWHAEGNNNISECRGYSPKDRVGQ